jgi:hypothetical protein
LQRRKQFFSGLGEADISRIQHKILGDIRLGQPGSGDPETVPARVSEDLKRRASSETGHQLLKQVAAYPGEALALVLHNLEHEKLSPQEKRRRKAQRATYHRLRQIQGLGGP